MNWEEELDFLGGKKVNSSRFYTFYLHCNILQSAPKQGRRGDLQHQNSAENLLDFNFENDDKPVAPIRTRKTGGWADEGNKLAKYIITLL